MLLSLLQPGLIIIDGPVLALRMPFELELAPFLLPSDAFLIFVADLLQVLQVFLFTLESNFVDLVCDMLSLLGSIEIMLLSF